MILARFSPAVAALALATASTPLPSPAATSGIAYDMVTKIFPGNDPPPEPGTFQSDFATAANPPAQDTPHMPFGLGRQMGQMQAAMAMFRTGTAERHYSAGSLRRVDHLAAGTAEIMDCGARTLTTLDLKAKTYTVVSLDHPAATSSSGASREPGPPRPEATDDGAKVAIDFSTRPLGAKNFDGTAADGYDSNVKTTLTKANGDSRSFDMETTSYYGPTAEPEEYCSGLGPMGYGEGIGAGMPGPGAAAMAQYMIYKHAMTDGKGNPRFSTTSSGPALPSGKLALYELVSMKGDPGRSFNMLMERGNVRSISDTDPAFSVPPDFTKTGT